MRPIATFLFGILILAVLIEEYRNSSISSGTFFSSDFGVSIRKVYHNVTRGPSRRRNAYIVLVDNRDLATDKSYGYYTYAMWQMYTSLVPDVHLLVYNSTSLCLTKDSLPDVGDTTCQGYNNTKIAPYWMKVLATRAAMDETNEDDLLLFMDSDIQLVNQNFNISVFDLDEIQAFLLSGKSMLVVSERINSWWAHEAVLYRDPIITTLYGVINNELGKLMMEIWWQSMIQPTKMDETSDRFKISWPWEQERFAAYYDAAPDLFYPLQQSWRYFYSVNNVSIASSNPGEFGWISHGVVPPGCCFVSKHLIIDDLNVTLPHQVQVHNLTQWEGLSFEELVYDLYHQIPVKELLTMEFLPISKNDPSMSIHNLTIFWNYSNYSLVNNNSVSDESGRYRRRNYQRRMMGQKTRRW